MAEEDINLDSRNDEDLDGTVLDWSQLNKTNNLTFKDEAIPKRSEKDADIDGSDLQTEAITAARNLMYSALEHPRGHHEKQFLPGVWIPAKKKALIPHAKGGFFKDIGYAHNFKNKPKQNGLWLSPLETVYLVERGSLILYLADEAFMEFVENHETSFDYSTMTQLTLSYTYSLAFSNDPDALDKYQVYSLLKRLGYLVRPFEEIVQYSPDLSSRAPQQHTIASLVSTIFTNLGFKSRSLLSIGVKHFTSYTEVFRALENIPFRKAFEDIDKTSTSPRYQIDFNAWRPQDFSKKNPPMPDYQVCVVNVAKREFPSIKSIEELWNQSNFSFMPAGKNPENTSKQRPGKTKMESKKDKKIRARKERELMLDPEIIKKRNYRNLRDNSLKKGSSGRSVVIAAIDNGIINFSNISETEFALTSNTSTISLDDIQVSKGHGLIWEEPLSI